MKHSKKSRFIIQISEGLFKIIKCLPGPGEEVQEMEIEPAVPEKIFSLFKKLKYKREPLIVCLPRSCATCRVLKVPAVSSKEIERIVKLQAKKFFPYASGKLLSAYQVISVDREGYSYVNMIIVPEDALKEYIEVFNRLNPASFRIVLSPWGLANIYNAIKPEQKETGMLVDLNFDSAELVIVAQGKPCFSRYIKFKRIHDSWRQLFIVEVENTRRAYLKESQAGSDLEKVVIFGAGEDSWALVEALNKKVLFSAEAISYGARVHMPDQLLSRLIKSDTSFAGLIGLGVRDTEASLNLIPDLLKQKQEGVLRRKKYLKAAWPVLVLFLLWLGAGFKRLENKQFYLRQLKDELKAISLQAMALEDLEDKAELMDRYSAQGPAVLDMLSGVYALIPDGVYLTGFRFADSGPLAVRGESLALDRVLDFTSALKRSGVFEGFNVKVKYARVKQKPSGEALEFEIECARY